MQPAKPAYPAKFYDPAYPSLQPSHGMMAAQGQWNGPHHGPLQPERGGCLRTSVLVTGILHIILSIFSFNVLGRIGGGFQIAGATAVRIPCDS